MEITMTQQEIFKNNLNAYVNNSGKSQKEIAEAIGVNPPTFNMWMKGNAYPRPDKIELLAKYFNIPVSELVNVPEFMTKDDFDWSVKYNSGEMGFNVNFETSTPSQRVLKFYYDFSRLPIEKQTLLLDLIEKLMN